MQAFPEFKNMDSSFWSLVKCISKELGYSKRKTKTRPASIKTHTIEEITGFLVEQGINTPEDTILRLKSYFDKRADILNNYVCKQLMDAQAAKGEFEKLKKAHANEKSLCKIPLNKQKGSKANINYFTAIVNIIAEDTIRQSSKYDGTLGFIDDPKSLAFIYDDKGNLVGVSSRVFDGAYPSLINPKAVWEIKEYYYTTTFGSRVADGIYESQLDGYEFRDLYSNYNKKVYHFFFIDAYKTWWEDGKSYLCRIIDFLNAGFVDEVIFGREVFSRWPVLFKEIVES